MPVFHLDQSENIPEERRLDPVVKRSQSDSAIGLVTDTLGMVCSTRLLSCYELFFH